MNTLGAFIESDLKKAEEYITKLTLADKSMPHLDCVYGLYARLYMWLEKYDLAEEYARKAIDNCTGHVMTQEEALNTSTGFNTATPWMWGVHINKESMINNLQNYCSFFSCETTWGYSTPEAGSEIMIDRSMYERISNTDWRKLMWKAPAGSALDGQNTYCDPAIGEALKDYSSLKFRPAAGNVSDFSAGGEMDYPLMRVEEMYFIEAEAAARQTDGVARAASLLENFMKANRDASYTCGITVQERLIEEILFQKRIELWGEGQAFFDVKRCNIPCTRSYAGSNHVPDEAFNLQHRTFDLTSRNAGPLFALGGQTIHPTQVSTTVDYGVYLQFLAQRGRSEVPLCAAMPQHLCIAGLDAKDVVGVHTYCRDDVLEVIDARYLAKLPKPPAAASGGQQG